MWKNIIISLIILTGLTMCSSVVLASTGSTGCPDGSVCLDNPLGSKITSVPLLIGQIVKAILGISGSLALVMFIFGGLTWMTAAGSPDKVDKGKKILVWATIGLIVIFSAYGMVRFVFTSLGVS